MTSSHFSWLQHFSIRIASRMSTESSFTYFRRAKMGELDFISFTVFLAVPVILSKARGWRWVKPPQTGFLLSWQPQTFVVLPSGHPTRTSIKKLFRHLIVHESPRFFEFVRFLRGGRQEVECWYLAYSLNNRAVIWKECSRCPSAFSGWAILGVFRNVSHTRW
jgi:hypothetical protein